MRSGYKGNGIVVAQRENVIKGIYDNVDSKYPFNEDATSKSAKHGTNGMNYILQVAPECTALAGINIKDVEADIYTNSITFKNDDNIDVSEAIQKGTIFLTAVGNDGEKRNTSAANNEEWLAIGACYLSDNDFIKMRTYSSITEHVDFICFDGLKSSYDNKQHTGTSFSSPLFAGMIALVQDYFLHNSGRKLTRSEMIKFIIDNSRDIGEIGKDNSSGNGLFILPNPEEIDIKKYVPEDNENKNEEEEEYMSKRYTYLKAVPEGEFHETIKDLIEKGFINGYEGSGEDTKVDLSEDMVRILVINHRSGLYE